MKKELKKGMKVTGEYMRERQVTGEVYHVDAHTVWIATGEEMFTCPIETVNLID